MNLAANVYATQRPAAPPPPLAPVYANPVAPQPGLGGNSYATAQAETSGKATASLISGIELLRTSLRRSSARSRLSCWATLA